MLSSRKNLFIFLLLFSLTFVTYQLSLRNQFIVDDHAFFSDTKILNLKYAWIQFVPDRNRFLGIDNRGADGYYRPLAHLVPMFEYAVFKMNGYGYHLVNIIFFALAGFLLFLFLFEAFKNFDLALLASAFFILHPINTVAINYKTATCFSLEVIFMLISALTLFKAVEKHRTHFYVASTVWYFMAVLCHETAMFLPLYLGFFLILIKRLNIINAAKALRWHILFLILYTIFRVFFSSLKSNVLDHFHTFGMGPLEFAATLTKLMGWYLRQIVWPDGVVLIWVTTVVRTHLWIYAILLSLVVVLLWWAFRRGDRSLKTGLGWFFISFIPVAPASLFRPNLGLCIEPHWLIFGSLGLFLFAAAMILRVRLRWLRMIIIVPLLTSYLLFDHFYSKVWGNEIAFCKFWIQKAPKYKDALLYLSNAYKFSGNSRMSEYYNNIILKDHYYDQYSYFALLLETIDKKEWDKAEEICKAMLEAMPFDSKIYCNLGIIYKEKNNFKKAEECFIKAVKLDPTLPEARLNLANLYLIEGKRPQALAVLKDALSVDPTNTKALFQLMLFFRKDKNLTMIKKYGDDLINQIDDVEGLCNMGTTLAEYGFYGFAATAFDKALRIDSRYKPLYLQEGIMLANLHRLDLACVLWQRGLQLYPDDRQLLGLINRAKIILSVPHTAAK